MGFGLFVVAMFLVAKCSEIQDEAELNAKTARAREADSAAVIKADSPRGMPARAAAMALDARVHSRGLAMEHAPLHLAAITGSLDSAEALIHSKAPLEQILPLLAPAEAKDVPAELQRRRGELYAALQPRIQQAAKQQAQADKQKAQADKIARIAARRAYAKTYEDHLLDQGINATVTVGGDDATRLTMKWALVSKVLAHQYAKGDILEEMRALGFKRFTITDGYDESWYWNLK